MGQPFVVENRPGAGAVIGTDAAAKAAPDGYTLLLMSNAHTVNETLIPNKPYALLRDFAPVAPINYSDLVLVVHPSVAANTLPEFLMRSPGRSPASSTTRRRDRARRTTWPASSSRRWPASTSCTCPTRAARRARAGVLGGQVEMMFDAVTTMSEQAKAGKVRALGTSGKARSAVMPSVPTVSEAGVPGYEAVIWLGVMAPKGTPAAIVGRLNAEVDENRDPAGGARGLGEAGRRRHGDAAGGVRPVRRRRHREVGKGRPDFRRQGRPVKRRRAGDRPRPPNRTWT